MVEQGPAQRPMDPPPFLAPKPPSWPSNHITGLQVLHTQTRTLLPSLMVGSWVSSTTGSPNSKLLPGSLLAHRGGHSEGQGT